MNFILGFGVFFIVVFGVLGILLFLRRELAQIWEERNGNIWLSFVLPYVVMCAGWLYFLVVWKLPISG